MIFLLLAQTLLTYHQITTLRIPVETVPGMRVGVVNPQSRTRDNPTGPVSEDGEDSYRLFTLPRFGYWGPVGTRVRFHQIAGSAIVHLDGGYPFQFRAPMRIARILVNECTEWKIREIYVNGKPLAGMWYQSGCNSFYIRGGIAPGDLVELRER